MIMHTLHLLFCFAVVKNNNEKHNEILSISNQNWLLAIQLTFLHLQIDTYVSFEYQAICKDVNAGLYIALDRNNKKSTCVACGMYNVLIFTKNSFKVLSV